MHPLPPLSHIDHHDEDGTKMFPLQHGEDSDDDVSTPAQVNISCQHGEGDNDDATPMANATAKMRTMMEMNMRIRTRQRQGQGRDDNNEMVMTTMRRR